MSLEYMESNVLSKENRQALTQTSVPSRLAGAIVENRSRQEESSFAFYEQLMRHDWHTKVRHRIRQRGWSR